MKMAISLSMEILPKLNIEWPHFPKLKSNIWRRFMVITLFGRDNGSMMQNLEESFLLIRRKLKIKKEFSNLF